MDGTKARAVLGVPRGAQQKTIIRTFREQAFATHPDRGGDAVAFAQVLQARDVALSLTSTSARHGYTSVEAPLGRRVWQEVRPQRTHSAIASGPDRSFGRVLDEVLARDRID